MRIPRLGLTSRLVGWTRGAPARRPGTRSIHLAAGLVLLGYVTTHLLNHALGLVSLAAMEAGRVWFLAAWRTPAGAALLYGAFVTHPLLALWALYRRRHLRMAAWDALRLVLGLAIPLLLVEHVMGTRVAATWFGATDTYTRTVFALWVSRPSHGARQILLLVVAWLHGAMGLHYWLRFRRWYPRAAPWLFAVALLLPVLAILGFVTAGREVAALARDPAWVHAMQAATGPRDPTAAAALDRSRNLVLLVFLGLLAATLGARLVRRGLAHGRGAILLTYPGGRTVTVRPGLSVLEASRLAGIPHASVCGGRGRCSTCRVRVTVGLDRLPAMSPAERQVLRRVGAPDNVRLACQLRPTHDVGVAPLLPPDVKPAQSLPHADALSGREQDVTVLFADLRGFTRLAERKLPYDVVFLLNRYFESVGESITRAGGMPNQFTGDGVMALFGVNTSPEEGSRRALVAAGDIVRALATLSRSLAEELPAPLRIGIGIHTGPAVVGRMGYGETVYLTAVGDTVHVASRLQELTKEYTCLLVISEQVAARAGVDVSRYPRHELTVRNRTERLAVRVIDDDLAGVIPGRGGDSSPIAPLPLPRA